MSGRDFLWSFIGFMLAMCIAVSIKACDESSHSDNYVCVNKQIIVREGFGKWNWDKQLIINSDCMKYYGWKRIEHNEMEEQKNSK